MAAMYAMADYDTYWLGLSYKGFDFRETHRDVTTGAAVQMMAERHWAGSQQGRIVPRYSPRLQPV